MNGGEGGGGGGAPSLLHLLFCKSVYIQHDAERLGLSKAYLTILYVCAVHWGISSVHLELFSALGDIISAPGVVQYIGRYH